MGDNQRATEPEIVDVTLVFEDEGDAAGAAPAFAQRPTRDRGGRRSPWARRRGAGTRGDEGGATLRGARRLPELRVPPGVLGVTLALVALVGVVMVNVSGAATVAGVTSAAALGVATLPVRVASVGSLVFGTFGAPLVVLGAFLGLRRMSRPVAAMSLLVTMVVGWVVFGLVGTATLGPVPFLVGPIAFGGALTLALVLASPPRARAGLAVVGGGLTLGLALAMVYAGSATAVGSLASVLVGAIGVALGATVWNRWLAPVLEARDLMSSAQAGSGA